MGRGKLRNPPAHGRQKSREAPAQNYFFLKKWVRERIGEPPRKPGNSGHFYLVARDITRAEGDKKMTERRSPRTYQLLCQLTSAFTSAHGEAFGGLSPKKLTERGAT